MPRYAKSQNLSWARILRCFDFAPHNSKSCLPITVFLLICWVTMLLLFFRYDRRICKESESQETYSHTFQPKIQNYVASVRGKLSVTTTITCPKPKKIIVWLPKLWVRQSDFLISPLSLGLTYRPVHITLANHWKTFANDISPSTSKGYSCRPAHVTHFYNSQENC